ncbi:MAG: hypothetical protein OEY96_13005 [Gammaproteobacteria bacterium]|nr:hypothetical protein [Gammaproteobacteria bacterium]
MTKERWKNLMANSGLSSSIECYESLCKSYSEKHRHYHTTEHINAMLRHLDEVIDLSENPYELELAIWFHDAIYKPFSSTNELDSAEWSKEFLLANNYDQAGVERVYSLIMATLHDVNVDKTDEKLIVDIDLSILGTPAHVYDEFEKNIRKEYKLVPWMIYRKKRKAILESFLSLDSIYHFDFFKDKFEQAARENINRAVSQL